MSLEAQISALVQASNNLTSAVNGKIGQIDEKIEEMDQRFQDEVNKFYSVGNFKNIRKLVNWIGDSTHYNYILLHQEPNANENTQTDDQTTGLERFGFCQYGEIFSGRITSGWSSLIFGRFLFHSGRGYADTSQAKVETPFSIGIAAPVIVKNFPHDGRLFRAIRFSPMSSQFNGLSISVSYNGDFRGTGGTDRNDHTKSKYWLACVGVDKTQSQPGEVIV